MLQPSYFDAIADVGNARGLYLTRALGRIDLPVSKGRLLAFGPDEELSDGLAEAETDGFFDVNNTPPWDTWVAFMEEPKPYSEETASYLISWVPPQLEELVQRGIDACADGSLRWLDQAEDPFARWLAAVVEEQRDA